MTAIAEPGDGRANAKELKEGESDTSYVKGGNYYKIYLNTASKVDMTLSLQGAKQNDQVVLTIQHGLSGMNDMLPIYTAPGGSTATLSKDERFDVDRELASMKGTCYFAPGWYYIQYTDYRETDAPVTPLTLSIDKITPINNTSGKTRETAPTINPMSATVTQTRFLSEPREEEHYYKFVLPTNAQVTIKKSVKLVPFKEDRWTANSVLRVIHDKSNPGSGNVISGKIGGKEEFSVKIMEKDSVLTKTIVYQLPKGTYYAQLDNSWSHPGTECKLTFSAKYQLAKATGLKLTNNKASWKTVKNNNGYTLQVKLGSKTVLTKQIKKGKTSYTFTKADKKKFKSGKKYKFTLVAKGTGNYTKSPVATSKTQKL